MCTSTLPARRMVTFDLSVNFYLSWVARAAGHVLARVGVGRRTHRDFSWAPHLSIPGVYQQWGKAHPQTLEPRTMGREIVGSELDHRWKACGGSLPDMPCAEAPRGTMRDRWVRGQRWTFNPSASHLSKVGEFKGTLLAPTHVHPTSTFLRVVLDRQSVYGKQMLLPFVLRWAPRVRHRCDGNSIKHHLPGSQPSLLHALSSSLLLPGSLSQRKHLQIEPTP